mgnify:CR=1 FL=1
MNYIIRDLHLYIILLVFIASFPNYLFAQRVDTAYLNNDSISLSQRIFYVLRHDSLSLEEKAILLAPLDKEKRNLPLSPAEKAAREKAARKKVLQEQLAEKMKKYVKAYQQADSLLRNAEDSLLWVCEDSRMHVKHRIKAVEILCGSNNPEVLTTLLTKEICTDYWYSESGYYNAESEEIAYRVGYHLKGRNKANDWVLFDPLWQALDQELSPFSIWHLNTLVRRKILTRFGDAQDDIFFDWLISNSKGLRRENLEKIRDQRYD